MKPTGMILSATKIRPGETYLLTTEAHLSAEECCAMRDALKNAAPDVKFVLIPGTKLEVKPQSILRQIASKLTVRRIRN
jgi:hypothetical protein